MPCPYKRASAPTMLSRIFHDKRLVALIFFVWGSLVMCMFAYTGVLHSRFMRFGPSEHVKFLDYKIDTWSKWAFVALFNVVDSAMWELAHEAIHPWEMNSVLDPKTVALPYSKTTCILILESYYLHGVIIGPIAFWISLTQVDFVLLKGVAIMGMRTYSHYQYIKDKESVDCV